jgi:hypothetical protein
MTIKKLASGREVGLGDIPLGECEDVLRLIANELLSVGIDINLEGGLKSLMTQDVNTIKNILLKLVGSKPIWAAAEQLMLRCKYNGAAIKPDTFEPKENRKDKIPTMMAVLKHALGDFIEGLDSPSA